MCVCVCACVYEMEPATLTTLHFSLLVCISAAPCYTFAVYIIFWTHAIFVVTPPAYTLHVDMPPVKHPIHTTFMSLSNEEAVVFCLL